MPIYQRQWDLSLRLSLFLNPRIVHLVVSYKRPMSWCLLNILSVAYPKLGIWLIVPWPVSSTLVLLQMPATDTWEPGLWWPPFWVMGYIKMLNFCFLKCCTIFPQQCVWVRCILLRYNSDNFLNPALSTCFTCSKSQRPDSVLQGPRESYFPMFPSASLATLSVLAAEQACHGPSLGTLYWLLTLWKNELSLEAHVIHSHT